MRLAVTTLFLFATLCSGVRAQDVDFKKIKRGRWKPQHVAKGFFMKRYGKYQFQSNWDKAVVKRLATHMNLMFKVYRKFSPPKKTPTDLLVIKLFKARKDFIAYGASPGAAAYYSLRNKEMVGYNTGKVGGESTIPVATGEKKSLRSRLREAYSMDVLGVFSHEGWHQYFHWTCGSIIPFPSWLDEGIGDYFYTVYVGPDKKIVQGAPMDRRLRTIQSAIRRNKHVPLEKMVHFEQRQYYRNAGQNYAQGWSMVHFFMEHPHYKKKKVIQTFVKVFIDQHSIKRTVPRVFPRKTKWARLEQDWKDWIAAIPSEIDPKDPSTLVRKDPNKRAREAFERLPPDVQKALKICVDRRSDRPGAKAATPPWMGGAPPKKPQPK